MFMFNTVRTRRLTIKFDNCAQRIPIHLKRGADIPAVSVALRTLRYWPWARPGIGKTRGPLRLGEGQQVWFRIQNRKKSKPSWMRLLATNTNMSKRIRTQQWALWNLKQKTKQGEYVHSSGCCGISTQTKRICTQLMWNLIKSTGWDRWAENWSQQSIRINLDIIAQHVMEAEEH